VIINLYKHRGYIWRTALAETRHRYAGAGLGVVWNLLQPLAMIIIFSVIFTHILPRESRDGIAYPIFLCSALLPWMAFAECINRGTAAFVTHSIYLRKLPIPEQVFVAQATLTAALNLLISFSIFIAFAVAFRHPPMWEWLLVPVVLALLMSFAFGIGLALGTINAFIRDVGQVVPILIQIGFWTVPIIFPLSSLPHSVQPFAMANPVYPYLESARELFLFGRIPPLWMWAAMIGWAMAASAFGYFVLRRLRPELRDVI
jgi:lipopolysaccharide transport system permease protein